MAGDDHPFAVHQDRIRPPELPDTGRHLGDLRVRMRPGVPGMWQERAYRPKFDLRGEIHLIRGVTTRRDNPMLKWTLRVIAPKFIDRLMWRNSVITHNTLKYVKTDLHLCGLDLDKLSDLPKYLKKLLDVKLEVTKKTKGDNENIFFNHRIENDRAPGKFRQEAGDALVPF